MSFEIRTECACCGKAIELGMDDSLGYSVRDPDARPLFFVPMVDFTKLEAPSIVDDF